MALKVQQSVLGFPVLAQLPIGNDEAVVVCDRAPIYPKDRYATWRIHFTDRGVQALWGYYTDSLAAAVMDAITRAYPTTLRALPEDNNVVELVGHSKRV